MGKGKVSEPWTILPYNIGKIRDKYLVVTPFGSWSALSREEFNKLHSFKVRKKSPLFDKLVRDEIIFTEGNSQSLIDNFRSLHRNWFLDVRLHIAVVTDFCNFDCIYCQAEKLKTNKRMMSFEVATKVLEFATSARSQFIRLEIQGGEPLLNWPVVEFLVREARKINKIVKKNLMISLVSNLSLLDEKKAKFLIKNGVDVSTSLDGPEFIHDKQRFFKSGAGSYGKTTRGIKLWLNLSKKKKVRPMIGALTTVTKFSLPYYKEIVDEYLKWDFHSIYLRPVSPLGRAKKNWPKIGLSAEDFVSFWEKGLDYILELNKKGIKIREETAFFMLKKILKKKDPGHTDLESPCGAGRSQLAYDPKGDIYTCDEGRMIEENTFKLGNVLETKYQDIGKSPNFFYVAQSSMLDFWDYSSPFYPWSGTCPVLNWAEQGNPVVKITQTFRKKILDAQFEYLFEKIIFDRKARNIFEEWLK